MTQIAEGRMIVKRIHLKLRAHAVGETIIRQPEDSQPTDDPTPEKEELEK